eukprot:9466945-Pyramimonas_sp.AAC.1
MPQIRVVADGPHVLPRVPAVRHAAVVRDVVDNSSRHPECREQGEQLSAGHTLSHPWESPHHHAVDAQRVKALDADDRQPDAPETAVGRVGAAAGVAE